MKYKQYIARVIYTNGESRVEYANNTYPELVQMIKDDMRAMPDEFKDVIKIVTECHEDIATFKPVSVTTLDLVEVE